MLRFKRQAAILQIIMERGFVENEELARIFNVTPATIRRDLKGLAQQKLIRLDHGGSANMDYLGGFIEPQYETKLYINADKKQAIASAAISQLRDGEAVILDSGTTNMHIARKLRNTSLKGLTVITCDIQIANELCPDPNIVVVVLGGMLRKSFYSTYGPYTEYVLQNLKADKAFLGIDAASKENGVSNATMEEVPIKQLMIQISDEVIMVGDSSKFGKDVPYRVCTWGEINHVISDDEISKDYLEFFKSKEIHTTITPVKTLK